MKKNFIFLLLFCVLGMNTYVGAQTKNSLEEVTYNGVAVELPENANAYFSNKRTSQTSDQSAYVILQFYQIPNKEKRSNLMNNGVLLNDYLGNNAYLTEINSLKNSIDISSIRSIVNLVDIQKLDPLLMKSELPKYAMSGKHSIVLDLLFFSGVNTQKIQSDLETLGAESISFSPYFNKVRCQVHIDQLKEINAFSWLKYAGPIPPKVEKDDIVGQKMVGQDALMGYLGADQMLTGEGITVGIWDQDVEPHLDFNGRVTSHELEDHLFAHGNHVAGIMAGRGLVDPMGVGIAHNVKIESWNFNVGRNGLTTGEEMMGAALENEVSITQNSYGIPHPGGFLWPYINSDAELDQVTWEQPHVLHVFSSGNSRGNFQYGTSSKTAKNILTVGALTQTGAMSSFSSWGPVDDGRHGPHIAAKGVDVYSCSFFNDYELMDGTSQATPLVSGVAIQLYELYKKENSELPRADLIKGVLCNTATDLGEAGPDFAYGYGEINALRAAKVIKNNHFASGNVETGDQETFKIWVPEGTGQLKVMLSWSDYPSIPFTPNALINDLDLTVVHNGTTTLPLVLDAQNPSQLATNKEDHLNNIEQVVIDLPESGYYEFVVNGNTIPQGPQNFSITWDFVEKGVTLLSPVGGESYVAEKEMMIYWSAPQNNTDAFVVQISEDSGMNYQTVAELAPSARNYTYATSSEAKGNLKVRVINSKYFDESTTGFSVIGRPEIVSSSSDVMSWTGVVGATSYEVMRMEEGEMKVIDEVTTTQFSPEAGQYWYAVRAVNKEKNIVGVRSKAVDLSVKGAISNFPFDEGFDDGASNYLTIEKSKAGNATINYDTEVNSHYLKFEGGLTGATFYGDGSTQEVWNANPTFISTATLKTEIPDGINSLLFTLDAKMAYSVSRNQSIFRVYVNGQPVSDIKGQSYFLGSETALLKREKMYFDLTDFLGEPIQIELKALCRYPSGVISWAIEGDQVGIDNIHLSEKAEYDVALLEIDHPNHSLRLEEAEVKFMIANIGSKNLETFDFSYEVYKNGVLNQEEKETFSTELPTFNTKNYTFVALGDFSEEDALYYVKGNAEHANDSKIENNTLQGSGFYNFGNIVPMAAHDYTQTTTVSDDVVFTDGGTRVFNYPDNTRSVHNFVPADPTKKVKVEFTSFQLEEGYDYLYVFDGTNARGEPIAVLNGALGDNNQTTFTSTVLGGGLSFIFYSDEAVNEEGWVATVSQVEHSVDFDAGVTAIQHPVTHVGLTGAERVYVTVSNFGKEDISSFKVAYTINDGTPRVQNVNRLLESGRSVDIEFDEPDVFNTFGIQYEVKAYTILENDGVGRNDTSVVRFKSDYEPALGFGGVFITNVMMGDINQTSGDNMYEDYSGQELTIKYGETAELIVTKNDGSGAGKYWIDWNFNGKFEEEEGFEFEPINPQQMKGIIDPPYDVEPGKKRLRIRVLSFGEMNPEGIVFTGEVEDYSIILEGQAPKHDLAVKSIELEKYITPDAYAIPVMIENKTPNAESYQLKLIVDGVEKEVVEVSDHEGKSMKEVLFSSIDLVETITEIKIELISSTDEVIGNNILQKTINVQPLNTVFAYNILGAEGVYPGPISFHMQNIKQPRNIKQVNGFYVYAGTIAKNKWYNSSTGGMLSTIDPFTGEINNLGFSDIELRDMCYSEPKDKLYGMAYYTPEIYSIDRTTGASTLEGTLANTSIKTITCDIAGVLYGLDQLGNIYIINDEDWTTTKISSLPIFTGTSPHPHLFFDHNIGKMYLASRDNQLTTDFYQIWEVDPWSGSLKEGVINEGLSKAIGFSMFYDKKTAESLHSINSVKIQGLSTFGTIDEENREIKLIPAKQMDVAELTLQFSISPGAQLYYKGKQVDYTSVFDLTAPIVVEVRSFDQSNASLWSIECLPPLNDEAEITSYAISSLLNDGLVADIEGVVTANGISIDAQKEDNLTNALVSIEKANKSIILMGSDTLMTNDTKVNHTDDFMLKVVSEDLSKSKYYTVTTARQQNDQAELQSFTFLADLNDNIVEDVEAEIMDQEILIDESLFDVEGQLVISFKLSTGAMMTQNQWIQTSGKDSLLLEEGMQFEVFSEDKLTTETYTVKMKDSTDPTSIVMFPKDVINVFPNPTQGEVKIKHHEAGTLFIMDMNGKKVVVQELGINQSQLNLSHLLSGMYIVRFEGQTSELWLTKLIIE
ncbi:S8 family serine peptidase [Flammeovirga sp. EKP202]|uniref:S8 family serine peptidase n=1 Tax=Flammeovirga sp. EKP202 TaxID=2770592 RepID=UPI00165F6CD5|nr:S8 family serine peptidase [Flammeovirga sp. EKP202]MBD0403640.1 S8 family serine peptidase [Flammeovirga sp. EKP202]